MLFPGLEAALVEGFAHVNEVIEVHVPEGDDLVRSDAIIGRSNRLPDVPSSDEEFVYPLFFSRS